VPKSHVSARLIGKNRGGEERSQGEINITGKEHEFVSRGEQQKARRCIGMGKKSQEKKDADPHGVGGKQKGQKARNICSGEEEMWGVREGGRTFRTKKGRRRFDSRGIPSLHRGGDYNMNLLRERGQSPDEQIER